MMLSRHLLVAGVFAATPCVAWAQSLFAVGGFDPFDSMALYTVDAATGAATLVGETGVAGLVGIAWTGTDLVGLTTGNEFYSIDLATGAATLLFNQTGITPEGDLAAFGGSVRSSTTGALGTVGAGSVTIDAIYGQPFDLSGLAAESASSFIGYSTNAAGQDELYRLDDLGTATLIGATGTQSEGVGALDFGLDGTLFLSDGATLFTVDTDTGVATAVGAFGVSGVSGLAFVPAPGAALAFAAIGFVGTRRRRG